MKTKPFLLVFFGVAFAGWLALFLTLGPTGYRREFSESTFTFHGHEYPRKQAHDHYLAITKSEGYKLYEERPELHPPLPGRDPDLAALGIPHLSVGELEFVKAYEDQPLFQAEKARQFWFSLLINVFIFILVIVLTWRFGRAPIAKMLSEKVAGVRATLEDAAAERARAEERLAHARAALDGLPGERERVTAETDARVQRELAELEEMNAQSLAAFEQETEDRKNKEALAASMLVKRELVNTSIDRAMAKLREGATPADHAGWLDDFARGLEQRTS